MDSFKWLTVFFLLFSPLAYAISNSVVPDVLPCAEMGSKPQQVCTSKLNTTITCCNVWCTVMCPLNTYYMSCSIEYVQFYQCCDGYGGTDCLPVCKTGCEVNGQCVSPNNCLCEDGWTGTNCQQVADLTATTVLPNSIALSWDIPINATNIDGYYIYLDCNSNYTINITNEITIDDLMPFTDYRACIIPLVMEGNGTEYCIDVQTADGVPAMPPTGITVTVFSSESVLVTWSPPTQPNGIITEYTLYIDYSDNADVTTVKVDGQLSLYYIEGLAPNQNIGVNISASTSQGNGPLSTIVFNQTTDIPLADIPSNTVDGEVQLTTLSNSTLQLSWTPSLSNSVSFYRLSVIESISNEVLYHWTLKYDQSFEYTLELDEYVPYVLKQYAGNIENGEFGLIFDTTFYLKEGVPTEYPSNIVAMRTGTSSIELSWDPISVMALRGALTDYTIQYSQGIGSCDYTQNSILLITADTSVVLNNTATNMIYCITVSAGTGQGNGPSSPALTVPLTEYTEVSLYLSGINNCESWKSNNICTDSRIAQLRNRLISILNQNCSCINSLTQFFDEQLTCLTEESAQYTANLVGSQTTSSTALRDVLETWSNGSPSIIVEGMALQVTARPETNNVNMCPENMASNNNHDIGLGSALGISLLGWIITGICFVVCILRKNKQINKVISNNSEYPDKRPSSSGII